MQNSLQQTHRHWHEHEQLVIVALLQNCFERSILFEIALVMSLKS